MKRTLGTCYYPEHWPQTQWKEDARRMAELGLTWIRIGEFGWSRLEPQPGQLQWQWLDDAIDTLGQAGLHVVLGTPTPTPPRWMLDKWPDMLALDEQGRPRGFGSRRHYCFSHLGYRQESARITRLMAERYGANPYVRAWQTDNEYGCHDTVLSYSEAAKLGFRHWLREKYGTVEALNQAWGNVFWSMEYNHFEQIGLPNLTVTEANPAHVMDFRRYSSDQVAAFNQVQTDILRRYTSAPLVHNYMGRVTSFDHYKVGDDLDIAGWDSYPLGFLEAISGEADDWKLRFNRQGDPDFQAFHHDLYRTVGKGRWWVMEQQPGPVNWAPYNPAPLPGMVRLWSWEAFAHGAEAVCYFRWRQAPFAQEQMHSGLLRSDSETAPGYEEALQVADEIKALPDVAPVQAKVALVFDYESQWAWQTQPQGASFDYFKLTFDFYRAARKLGLSLDIIGPQTADLSGYELLLVPGLMRFSDALEQALQSFQGAVLAGPRTACKEADFRTHLKPLLPGLDTGLAYVESLRPGSKRPLRNGGCFEHWAETLTGTESPIETQTDGKAALVGNEKRQYLAGWPDQQALVRMLQRLCDSRKITATPMPDGVRQRHTGDHRFVFNYNDFEVEFQGQKLPPAGVHWEASKI